MLDINRVHCGDCELIMKDIDSDSVDCIVTDPLYGFVSSYGNVRHTPEAQHNHHATVKPIKLMSWLITLASREGDIVLDPFCGSGTTLIAAKMLGRQYIGIEREKDYCEIARKRVSAIPMGLSSY